MSRLKQDKGLTLLELAVAIVVLAIGSLAAIRATDQSRVAIGGEMPRLLAGIAARNRAEELQLLGPFAGTLPSQVRMGGQDITLAVQREATAGGLTLATVTARTQSGEGAFLTVYLSSQIPQ